MRIWKKARSTTIRYIPNRVSVDVWKEKEELTFEISKLIKELKEDNYFLLGYAGSHGILKCLTCLIDTCQNTP